MGGGVLEDKVMWISYVTECEKKGGERVFNNMTKTNLKH